MKSFSEIKLLFSTPCSLATLYKKWFESFMLLKKPQNWSMRIEATLPLDVNRNNTIKFALENSFDYIMWIDHDNLLDNECLLRLWSYNFDVVGSLYFERAYPNLPLIYVFPEERNNIGIVTDYPKGIVKCDVIGMGCSLWRTEVFKKIQEPWFTYNDGKVQWGTEDVCCFMKLKDAGIPVYCDTQHPVGHVGEHVFDERDWLNAKPHLEEWKNTVEGKKTLCPTKST
jgi:glycosyltransferase involved in cell wall biosynthesis